MAYWIKRIALKTGEVVTERELREDQNRFDGPAPVVGDLVEVECRGRRFLAKVITGNWPGRVHAPNFIVPLRVAELGLDEATPLRFPSRRGSGSNSADEPADQPLSNLVARMRSASRQELIMLLAAAIVEMTILGRSHYDDEKAITSIVQINESIHRLAGHLRDLSRQTEEFSESRAASISEQLKLLHTSAIARVFNISS